MNSRELALVISGDSGMVLAVRFAVSALQTNVVDAQDVVVTGAAGKVLAHELPGVLRCAVLDELGQDPIPSHRR